jgi:multidrug efflux pump subunit AcrB
MTTIGGLSTLMFETSLQAQFLIPMATTIVFGLAFTTALVLFVVPATLSIGRDLSALFGGVWRFARALW